jgi:ABC-type phosphate transport system ATPase subunit
MAALREAHRRGADDTTTIFSNPSVKATEDYVSGRFG